MQPTLNFWAVLILIAAGHGVLLAVAVLTIGRSNRTANRLLAALIFVFSFRLLEVVAYWTKYLLEFPHLFSVTVPMLYLYGPLLYLYARSLGAGLSLSGSRQQASSRLPSASLGARDLWHALPYLIHTLAYVPLYLLSGDFKVRILTEFVYIEQPTYTVDLQFLLHFFQLPHLLLYVVLTARLLKKYAADVDADELTVDRIKLDWLRLLTITFGGFWAFWFFYTMATVLGAPYLVELDYVFTASLVVIIVGIGVTAIRQPEVIAGWLKPKPAAKYTRSGLDPARVAEHLHRLHELMASEKPYLIQGLKLEDLASRLAIPSHHLSQVINDGLGQSFHDVVNGYRIKAAKARLADPAENHATILSIAYDAGFNNKTTFNAAFKKHVGMTPSRFRASSQSLLEQKSR